MTDLLRIEVGDGKYTVVCEEDGALSCLRYDAEWRNLTGDKMVLTLAQEVQSLRETQAVLLGGCKKALKVLQEVSFPWEQLAAEEALADAIEKAEPE